MRLEKFAKVTKMIHDIWFSFPLWLQILIIVFVAVWLVQMLLMAFVFARPLWRNSRDRKHKVPVVENLPGVSVVVYAHNQSEDLLRNLPVLLDSQYPDFEVIVVDDGSRDETEDVLTQMDQRSEHFFHTTIAEKIQTVSHRKLAMLLGVKAAHNDIILMTQAQCIPSSPNWIESMARLFVPGVDAVVGPVVYESRVGLMNRFYQWDFFERILNMMSLTLSVKTFEGWSYNMAFRKEAFYADKNRSIQHYLGIHPGEDDLFLREITHGKNVTVACSADAVVINEQSPIHYNWRRERLNHAFTQQYYFMAPCVVKHINTITRYICALSGAAVIGVTASLLSWWVMGIAIFLFLAHALTYVLIPYFIAKRLGVHRYKVLPLLSFLYTPLVDIYFSLSVMFKSNQFYVGRID